MNKLTCVNTFVRRFARQCRHTVAGLGLMLVGGCAALSPTTTPQPSFYSLDNARTEAPAATLPSVPQVPLPLSAPTLIVNPPYAASGITSQRIIYTREAHKLEYFSHSEWVDPPARMLAPLIVAAIENSGAFRAVVLTPSAAAGDLRLDTEIIRLQHEFYSQPSRVRFTLRAYLVEDKTRRVLGWREFDTTVAAASENPYGGVIAANRAVQIVLEALSAFCIDIARNMRTEK